MKLEIVLLALFTAIQAGQWDTYPEVPKTASINGFADPIYDELPKCARDCVKASTGNTPCPYWDTGCLCVMPQWSGLVAQCIAEKCEGEEVVSATSLAYELCSSVGADIWLMPASITAALTSAAGTYNVAAPTPTNTEWNTLLDESDQEAADSIEENQDDDSETDMALALDMALDMDKSTSASGDDSEETGDSDDSDDSEESSSVSGLGMKLSMGSFTLLFGSFVALLV